VFVALKASSQSANSSIHRGNELYKQKNYTASLQEYHRAITLDPKNPMANYNNGNAEFRNNQPDEAVGSYDNTIDHSTDKALREKAYYNKGVALSKQQKLQESIDAWKDALKINPDDRDARENLQKALMELKKKQEQQNKENKDQKKQEQNKQQEQQKPQPQQSKLNKQQVDQLLKALQQKEKEIQLKMQKGSPTPNKPEKDW
jgi:Ca-activated chloride channel family protein